MSKLHNGEVSIDLALELRRRAAGGTDVTNLIDFLRSELELRAENAALPVIMHFRAAFDLSLREALPLREWIAVEDRSEVDSLLIPAMMRNKDRWAPHEPCGV